MTVREYLRQYEKAKRRVRRLEAHYHELEEIAGAVKSPMDQDGQPKGFTITRPTEEKAIRLAEALTELEAAREEAEAVLVGMYHVLDKIGGVYGDILIDRYISLMRWEDIADTVHYSLRQTHRLHQKALNMLREMIE